MNLDIFRVPDPSGRMSKESYLSKNHTEEYDYILDYCKLNYILDISFKEKVYLCINNLKKFPSCHNSNCDKEVKFKNSTIGYLKYCSNKCISSDPNIKKIKEEKSLEKFGTKTPAESKIIKDKIIKTNQERYGANSAMCLKETQDKSKETLLKNYGVENPSESLEITKRRVKSFKDNIGQYKESYRNTSMEKYGVDHPWKNNNIHKKSVDSTRKIKIISTHKIISRMIPISYKIVDLNIETGESNIICDLNHTFKSTRNFIYNRYRINSEICTVCNPISNQKSGSEILLFKFIKEIYEGDVVESERSIINPFEIDIYLPELKLGVEYNGLWWHSSEYREYDYHLSKQRKSIESGTKLLTIWEDDWINKTDIVKSFLINKLNKITNKIYARSCNIIEVNKYESGYFLYKNHFNGKSKSSVRISLVYNNEIVSLMTFKKSGSGWVLDRFCSKNYTCVIGSFSRILNYFLKKYNPNFILTYSDNMISDGDIYKRFGFEYLSEISPTYTLLVGKKRVHRLSIKNINLYPKIYNAGLKKWIYKLTK